MLGIALLALRHHNTKSHNASLRKLRSYPRAFARS